MRLLDALPGESPTALGRTIAIRNVPSGAGVIETGAQCLNAADDDGDTLVNDGCPNYLLANHLGSTVGVLDSTGAKIEEMRYWP